MREAWIVGLLAAALAGCGQGGSGNAGAGGGGVAGGGAAGGCAAFAGRWTDEDGGRLTIAPDPRGYDIALEYEVGGETLQDYAKARCEGGRLVATNRRIPDTTRDAAADTVTFMEMPYRRAP